MKTILMFDTYSNMLEVFHRFLSQENYRLLTTETLEEVVLIIKVIRVDLLIMDTGKNSEFEGKDSQKAGGRESHIKAL